MPYRVSLSNRLALLFFAITLLAIGFLYLYVAPGLETRLLGEQLSSLSAAADRTSDPVLRAVGGSVSATVVRTRVQQAALSTGDRVTLLLVTRAGGALQLSPEADSAQLGGRMPARSVALRAARSGRRQAGTENAATGLEAEAAVPISFAGRVGAVLVYSVPVSEIVRNVGTVRHEILVAGAIALLLALFGGLAVARALTRRVKRLERAAEQVAAGDFEHPVPVDSRDELGQVALAFNEMQRQLAALDSARKKFIATASHELRTPIFSLGGFIELLEDEELDPATRRRFLDQIRDQIDRLRKLSVDLLDLSRLEAGSLELRPEQVDLGELTRSVSSEFEPSLAHHDSHLELRLGGRHIEAQCDPVRVAQIVRILIDNALSHTRPGSQIVVTASSEAERVRLAVRDDGQGIPSAVQREIFEPFYTADDAQGSGLGLAIASELAERMRGSLSVRSQPGETVFTLELPA